MSTDEITTFREGRPDVGPYDPAAKARARARLLDAEPRRRSFRFPRLTSAQGLLAVGAATAVLIAGPTFAIKGLGGNEKTGPGPARVFGPGATDDRPRPGQWAYLKTVMAASSKGQGGSLFGPPDRRATIERWRSVDDKQTARIEKGRLKIEPNSVMPGMSPRADYPYLLSLPTEPAALLAKLNATVDKEYVAAKPSRAARAARTFEIIEIYMRDAALPATLRSALYTVLKDLPGVKYEAKAADILGRPGVTFYRIDEGYLRNEIMIDPVTHQYLGFRAIAIRSHVTRGDDRDLRAKPGQILGWGGLAKVAVVPRPGQRPS